MLKQIVLVCGIALVQHGNFAAAIECYTCTNSSSLPDCKTTVKCPTDAVCASEFTTINGTRMYDLGCRDLLTCPVIPTITHGSSSIIGRSATKSANCSDCCHSNFCNRQICQDADPQCADDKGFDCVSVGAITNICADASHIKPYCKRFCGFCNTVDGGWSHWSQWSHCSVTCGNGTQTRSRTCSDPAPANGGTDCPGVKQEQETCMKDLCPVHGGWGSWSEWGSCSKSCDFGLQRRDRACSNPYPARHGDHCYGESRDDRLCFPGACANGGWSSWGIWGACTTSCGGGVMTRNRNCDHPAPSMTGKDCAGNPMQASICNNSPCQDGGWSSWGHWGVCSLTCGGGIKTRSRQCNNPTPSMTGLYCGGDSSQTNSCNVLPCFSAIGFSVNYPKEITHGVMIFKNTVANTGNIYNKATGVFTCRTPGYYYFSASLLRLSSYVGSSYCYIIKNNENLAYLFSRPGSSPSYIGYTAAVGSTYVHLAKGDTVKLTGCSELASWELNFTSIFSGFLVTADAT